MGDKINSKEYWNKRFASGDWAEKGGNSQTQYFYNLLLDKLPESIKTSFDKKDFTICDVGCAEGDGTKVLKDLFMNSKVSGIDISEAAVEKANKNYENIDFSTHLDKRYDAIISSNTLEHFEDPSEHLEMLFKFADEYVILLVPFEEYEREPEHFFTFDYKYFNLKYYDFNLIFFNESYADKTVWDGKQLLLVFQKNTTYENITLDSFGVASLLSIRENQIFENIDIIEKQKQTLDQKELELKEISNLNHEKDKVITNQKALLVKKDYELNEIYNSNFWKLASKYYDIKEKPFISPFVKVARNIKKYGFVATLKKTKQKAHEQLKKIQHEKQNREKLETILNRYKNETIIILPMLVDWNIPLFQRPQHLAKNLANQGFLYFYCTGNAQYDRVNGFDKIEDRCYVTNRFDLVDKIKNRQKYYDLSSTDNIIDWNFINNRLDQGYGIIYQYIDEISDDLSGFEIPQKTWEKHNNILKDERCIVIPSATKLENDVKEHRSKNFKLVTNGVEIKHFSQKIVYEDYPDKIKKVVDKKKPIIGYFGAFANWFDYELVKFLATKREDLEIVLLGWDYDGSIKKAEFDNYKNITVLGPIQYPLLPKYAACFDVSTITFMINDITESTSPIKLFEYMAMGKPIVTTDMPECRKYKSVLIGKDHDEFVEQIDKALSLRDDVKYLEVLKSEAADNSWESKAIDIASMIK
jgi:glycosyltransferase involved in cell wall biosynthesis